MKLSFYPSTVFEDIALCLGVTFLSACLGRDDHLPPKAAVIIRSAAMLLCILCWLVTAFVNGLRMRGRFAAGMCICLIIPPIISLAAGTKQLRLSLWAIGLDKLCSIFSSLPFYRLERAAGIKGYYFSAAVAVMGLMLFGAGYLYTKKMISNLERNDTL